MNDEDLSPEEAKQYWSDLADGVETPTEPEEPSDPWESVPQVVRERLELLPQMEQRLRTSEGRVSALQRDLDIAKHAARAVENAPSDKRMEDASGNLRKWNELKEEFPEWVEAIDERFSMERHGVSDNGQLLSELEGLRQREAQTTKELAELRVSVVHPGWESTVKTEQFAQWMQTQPVEVQMLAASESPSDAIKLLNAYDDVPSQHERARKLSEDRAARLRSSATQPARNAGKPPKSEEDMSGEEYWNALAKAKAKQRQANNW